MKNRPILVGVFMIFCFLALVPEKAAAFAVTDMFFTNISCDSSSCSNPVPVTSFTDLDLGVTAWAYYSDYEAGKTWRMEWYSPTNVLAQSFSNTPSSTISWSYRCVSRETLLGYGNGQWTVNFYYDGHLSKTASFTYTITQSNIWHAAKIYAIPDYLQTDDSYGGFAEGGANYCAPTSVSNSLMWLANNGFPNLAHNTSDSKKDQYDLILNLGTNYMITDPFEGTNVYNVISGVKNYLSDKGYRDFQLRYQGWREHPPESETGVSVPDLGWIKNGIAGTGSVWLNLGWYTYDQSKDQYTRTGGHWVTLVGSGYNGNPDYLIIHDPLTCYFNHYVLPAVITSGTLTGTSSGLPRNAVGFYKMNNGMRISNKGDFGILDGAVVLKMGPAPSAQLPWLMLLLEE